MTSARHGYVGGQFTNILFVTGNKFEVMKVIFFFENKLNSRILPKAVSNQT